MYKDKTIVTGIISSGRVRNGDQILFSPGNISGEVKSIELMDEQVNEAEAGDIVGIGFKLFNNKRK